MASAKQVIGGPLVINGRQLSLSRAIRAVFGEYFPDQPPTRSAVVSDLLVDVRVGVEVVACRPDSDPSMARSDR